jgi:SAM-dependent methyltransferase
MSDLGRWETRFDVDHYLFGTEPNAFLARNAWRFDQGGRVLSVADGEGRNGVWLARQGHRVTSQDFSPRGQEKARALATAQGVTLDFELSDICAREWAEAAFDGVVGIFFQFLTPAERAVVFARIARTVRPGGWVLIEGYGPKQLDHGTGGPKVLDQLYTPDLLHDAFADFAKVDVTAYDAEVGEGPGHSGMSALVDMVARK